MNLNSHQGATQLASAKQKYSILKHFRQCQSTHIVSAHCTNDL
jgi:hypothetical protein